jgi:hypothetical protein
VGHATQNELIGQYVDHVDGLELPIDPSGKTFVRAIPGEVRGPDVVGLSARKRIQDPSANQMRPCLDCLAGTFSPSRRQILLSLTIQPAVERNISAIFR